LKIAFVIPWYGNIPGGAEAECKHTAENLQKNGVEVEVLTTCVKEFRSNWNSNYYKEGTYEVDGITVRRFKVRKRDNKVFDHINYKLMHDQKISCKEEQEFLQEMVNSDNLYSYIKSHGNQYDYFLFIPYMFGTTYYGSKIHPEKSILIPCLHNESYAYLDIYKPMFEKVKGIIFHSEQEKRLANKLYNIENKQSILGGGINTDFVYDANRFRNKYGIKDNFILYAGRKEIGKNVPLLIDFFCKYKNANSSNLKLVLIGSGSIVVPSGYEEDIIDLGFVPLQNKYDAYSAATFLCQPSINESFSIVIMEAWLCNVPVLVNAECSVTKEHCIKSNGGLYFEDYYEFSGCVDFFLRNHEIRKQMGVNGMYYVLDNFSWDVIVQKYIDFLGGL